MKRRLGTLMKNTRSRVHRTKRSNMQWGELRGTDGTVSGSKPQLEVIFFLCCFGTGQNLCSCWKPSLLKGVLKQRHELPLKCRKCVNIFICRLHVSSDLLFSVSVYWVVNNNNNVHLSCAHQCPEHSHINLNTIFYTHIEHSPTKTIYIRY